MEPPKQLFLFLFVFTPFYLFVFIFFLHFLRIRQFNSIERSYENNNISAIVPMIGYSNIFIMMSCSISR